MGVVLGYRDRHGRAGRVWGDAAAADARRTDRDGRRAGSQTPRGVLRSDRAACLCTQPLGVGDVACADAVGTGFRDQSGRVDGPGQLPLREAWITAIRTFAVVDTGSAGRGQCRTCRGQSHRAGGDVRNALSTQRGREIAVSGGCRRAVVSDRSVHDTTSPIRCAQGCPGDRARRFPQLQGRCPAGG